jgi:glutamate dehydrogenase
MAKTTLKSLSDALADRLTKGALPGELQGFGKAERAEAANFVATAAYNRPPGAPTMVIEPIAANEPRRRMRVAIVNDDMPFLVDSVAATIAAQGIAVDRIIHPVIPVTRDPSGGLMGVGDGAPESMIYIEMERADARERRTLVTALEANLKDVRAAVSDWVPLQEAMAADAAALTGAGAELLNWFLDRHFTLLGHGIFGPEGGARAPLGICRNKHETPILAETSRALAIQWFEKGGEAPLLLKSNFISSVHRHIPLDLIVVPIREGKKVVDLSIHAGLWTSSALSTPPDQIPVLRTRLAVLQQKFGFDPKGHAGKALEHALTALPHDLLIAFTPDALEEVSLTAMSLADRPRPRLVMARSILGRHLFCFVWLPRDEFTTARRIAIGDMLAEAAGGSLLNWAIAMDDLVALIRYTVDLRGEGRMPDVAALDTRLARMMRGWAPAVEAALAESDAARATRLALRWANCFPQSYRTVNTADEAARDILSISTLDTPDQRAVRLYRDARGEARLKLYRLGGAIALSDAVPVLENFGFRVIEEVPTALTDEGQGFIHEFLIEAAGGVANVFDGNTSVLEQAVGAVLEGNAENDAFNRLIVDLNMAPSSALLFRAWFRYLRQGGLTYGLTTVVDALRRAPAVTAALIDRFDAAHAPGGKRDAGVAAADEAIKAGLNSVSAIDDDRILRAIHGVIAATLRTNAFTPAAAEALAFKLDSHQVPGLPAPLPWREIWVYSPRVEGIHLRAGPVARGGLRWSDRRDVFRTEILGLMKAQRVKNAVNVPPGAKGGFYPKQLPSPAVDRDAWLAEGTESYRIINRSLQSVTDNNVRKKMR